MANKYGRKPKPEPEYPIKTMKELSMGFEEYMAKKNKTFWNEPKLRDKENEDNREDFNDVYDAATKDPSS